VRIELQYGMKRVPVCMLMIMHLTFASATSVGEARESFAKYGLRPWMRRLLPQDSLSYSPAQTMGADEREILFWMHLGSGLQTACINSDVSICRALDWLDEGRAKPWGWHGSFARQVQAIEVARPPAAVNGVKYSWRHRAGLNGSNGNGNGSANGQQVISWRDL
jgi:hypothetical protein